MKIPPYLLPLALLTACTPDSATTASAPEASTTAPTTAAKDAAPLAVPGEPCTIQFGNLTFTRSLNGAAQHATVDKGVLTLRAEAKSDNFNDPDGKLTNQSAPVLLTQVDNTKPFTLTARVAPQFLETYDAGVLYVYLRPDWWQKFCFERDERARTRVVSVRTIGTSDDNDHDLVTAKQVYLKISSDAKTIGFYHSLDGKQWELARLYKNDYPATIWLGLSSQAPVGNGMSTRFDNCTLTQTSIADFRLGQ
jgi:regulation of enolase protein 1 (concanavalin A-like superfamily)